MEELKFEIVIGKDGRITIPSMVRNVLGLDQGDAIELKVNILTGLTTIEKIEN